MRTAAARTGRNLFPACGLSTHVSKDVGDPSRGCRALVETYGQYNALASGRTDTVKGALSPGRSACSAAAGSIGRRVPARLIPVSARTSPPGGSHASRVHEVDGGSGGEWSRPTCVRPSPSADAVGARRDDHLKSLNRHRTDEDGLSVAVLCTAFCAATGCTESETASAPATVVLRDRFAPEWLRVMARPGGSCVLIANRSGVRYDALYGTVEADGVSQLCFGAPGVYRVRPGLRPYSGGFYVGAAEP